MDEEMQPMKVEAYEERVSEPGGGSSTWNCCLVLPVLVVFGMMGALYAPALLPPATPSGWFALAAPGTSEAKQLSSAEVQAVRKECEGIRSELEEYYAELEGNVLEAAWKVRKGMPEFDEVEARMAGVFARALLDPSQKTFVIGAIGSSVTMGHDNCYHDNYENQLQRYFSKVMEAAGMALEVRTAGTGGWCGDDQKNEPFCMGVTAGQNCDIYHYSWTSWEPLGDPEAHENAIRIALMMNKKQPPLHVFQTTLNVASEIEPYYKYGANALGLEDGLKTGGEYAGTQWGHVGDGLHNTTRYGELIEDKARRDSLGVVFRNWHPGPLGFQFVADAFAYHYAGFILTALDVVEAEWAKGNDPAKSVFQLPVLLASDMPEPVVCDPKWCTNDAPPQCLNFEEPTFGSPGPSVVDPDDDLNPHKGKLQNWTHVLLDEGPTFKVDKADQKYAKEVDPTLVCAFPDHCAGMQATSPDDGCLVVKLPKMTRGIIAVCGFNRADMKAEHFAANPYVNVELNGKRINNESFKIIWKGIQSNCVQVLDGFPADMRNTGDPLHMAISLVGDNTTGVINIGQIITL